MSTAKAALRDRLCRERAALQPPYREDATARVNMRLVAQLTAGGHTRIGGYAASPAELNIDATLTHLIAVHGQVFLPRVCGDNLEFCACTDLDALTVGYAGIREPDGEAVPPETIQTLLIPGVGFDPSGRRLGHGGGFYDRILAKVSPSCVTVGVAFDRQLVPAIPTEPHDLTVQYVITENHVYDSALST